MVGQQFRGELFVVDQLLELQHLLVKLSFGRVDVGHELGLLELPLGVLREEGWPFLLLVVFDIPLHGENAGNFLSHLLLLFHLLLHYLLLFVLVVILVKRIDSVGLDGSLV